jgi:hypothetical protein
MNIQRTIRLERGLNVWNPKLGTLLQLQSAWALGNGVDVSVLTDPATIPTDPCSITVAGNGDSVDPGLGTAILSLGPLSLYSSCIARV